MISDKKDKLFHYIHKLNENFTIMTFVNKNRQALFKEKIKPLFIVRNSKYMHVHSILSIRNAHVNYSIYVIK